MKTTAPSQTVKSSSSFPLSCTVYLHLSECFSAPVFREHGTAFRRPGTRHPLAGRLSGDTQDRAAAPAPDQPPRILQTSLSRPNQTSETDQLFWCNK